MYDVLIHIAEQHYLQRYETRFAAFVPAHPLGCDLVHTHTHRERERESE